MEEIKKTLMQIQKDSKKALASNQKSMKDARNNSRANQWYINDLILQESVVKTRVEFANMMLELIAKLEQGQTKPTIRKSIIQEEIIEDEEDILRRFKS